MLPLERWSILTIKYLTIPSLDMFLIATQNQIYSRKHRI